MKPKQMRDPKTGKKYKTERVLKPGTFEYNACMEAMKREMPDKDIPAMMATGDYDLVIVTL